VILSSVAGVALICVVLAIRVWHKGRQVQALQAEVDALRGERQATESRLNALQSTATALENRVVTLEANDPDEQLAALQKAVEAAKDAEQVTELRTTMAGIQGKVDSFRASLDALAARMDVVAPQGSGEGTLPAEARLDVARQKQSHSLSCESSAASMAAQYHGVDLSEADVLAALPRNANPYLGFRGNPDGPTGGIEDYGVYAGPITAILNSRGVRAWEVPGGLDGVKAAIARGNPVIVWVTYNCLRSTPVEQIIGGQKIMLVPDQHAVVVVGYNSDGVLANDPWDGQEDFYTTADFRRAMAYFGDMAIEVAAP
jgi:uncharacterized protein YvpB